MKQSTGFLQYEQSIYFFVRLVRLNKQEAANEGESMQVTSDRRHNSAALGQMVPGAVLVTIKISRHCERLEQA